MQNQDPVEHQTGSCTVPDAASANDCDTWQEESTVLLPSTIWHALRQSGEWDVQLKDRCDLITFGLNGFSAGEYFRRLSGHDASLAEVRHMATVAAAGHGHNNSPLSQ